MRVRIRTPEPHSPSQRQLIEAFLTPGLREFWVACGTKWGKSFGASGAFTAAAPLRPQALWRWIGPIYLQALVGFKYLQRMLPSNITAVKNAPPTLDLGALAKMDLTEASSSGTPEIRFPTLDSTIQFFHGQNPESLEGEATAGNLIDEAAKQKEQVYISAKTTTTYTGGIVGGVSTPKGKNWFYKRYMAAKEEMERAKVEKRPPRMIAIHAPTYANPGIAPEIIEEMRERLPRRLFAQYVEAEFLDDGSVFEFTRDAFGFPLEFWRDEVWFASTHESKVLYVGADWAKQHDYTVFIAINDQGRCVAYRRLPKKVPYPEQVAALYAFIEEAKRNSILVGCHVEVEHDQTGVGEAIDDIIRATNPGYDIAGIVWTNQLKETYVTDLILTFQEKGMKLPPWETLRAELDQFEVQTLPSGRVTYSAPEGMHDDTVMALVLANRLFRAGRAGISSVAVVDYLNNLVQRMHYGGSLD